MVFLHGDENDFALELSSLDSTLDDDFLSSFTNGETYVEDIPTQLHHGAPCVELQVYCDVGSKKVSKLVGVYMRTFMKLYNSRGSYTALDWRFASRTDSPLLPFTIPVFFYSANFVKSAHCVQALCDSSDNAIFIVIDPSISPDHENFVSTARQHILGKTSATSMSKLKKIAERLRTLDGIQRLSFPTHVPAYENAHKLLKTVEAVLPSSAASPSLDELVIQFPSREDVKLDYHSSFENDPPLLDNKLFDSLGLQVDPLSDRPTKAPVYPPRDVKRKRKKCDSEETTSYMNSIPKRQFRVKGQIYVVNKIRKKWDGRQWRRLCQYKNCDHAARGSITFCVSHYKLQCAETNKCDKAAPLENRDLKDRKINHVPLAF